MDLLRLHSEAAAAPREKAPPELLSPLRTLQQVETFRQSAGLCVSFSGLLLHPLGLFQLCAYLSCVESGSDSVSLLEDVMAYKLLLSAASRRQMTKAIVERHGGMVIQESDGDTDAPCSDTSPVDPSAASSTSSSSSSSSSSSPSCSSTPSTTTFKKPSPPDSPATKPHPITAGRRLTPVTTAGAPRWLLSSGGRRKPAPSTITVSKLTGSRSGALRGGGSGSSKLTATNNQTTTTCSLPKVRSEAASPHPTVTPRRLLASLPRPLSEEEDLSPELDALSGTRPTAVLQRVLEKYETAKLIAQPSVAQAWATVRAVVASGKECRSTLFDDVLILALRHIEAHHFAAFCAQTPFYLAFIQLVHFSTIRPGASPTQFEWLGRIGSGGYGSVFLARRKDTGGHFAVKVMDKRLVKLRRATRLLSNERAALGLVNSPFLNKMKYAFQDECRVFLAMDVVYGGDLARYLQSRRSRRLTDTEAQFVVAEVVLALQYLHSRGIAHRDIKPSNILLSHNGHIQLADLGLCCFVRCPAVASSHAYMTAEQHGIHVRTNIRGRAGTPGYWAPEMLDSDSLGRPVAYTGSVDFWSLGCLMYTLLAGKNPFLAAHTSSNRDPATMMAITPNLHRSVFSTSASGLLKHLLDRSPATRLGATAGDFNRLMAHPWFASIDWEALRARRRDASPFRGFSPALKVDKRASPSRLDSETEHVLETVSLSAHDQHAYRGLQFTCTQGVNEEILSNLVKRNHASVLLSLHTKAVDKVRKDADKGTTGGATTDKKSTKQSAVPAAATSTGARSRKKAAAVAPAVTKLPDMMDSVEMDSTASISSGCGEGGESSSVKPRPGRGTTKTRLRGGAAASSVCVVM